MSLDLGIIGGGIMGLAVARAARAAGCRVTVYEQGPLPNPHGSSLDRHRLIRYPYGADSAYQAMVTDAYGAWDRLWADLGVSHYVPTGTLVLGDPARGYAAQSAASLHAAGMAIDWLAPADIARRWPLLADSGYAAGFHLASGGVLLADRIMQDLLRWLAESGVQLHAHTPVRAVDPQHAVVTMDEGTIRHDRVVVATGAWLHRLLPHWLGRATPSQQLIVYLEPGAARPDWAAMPMVLGGDAGIGFYAIPGVADTPVKIGDHSATLWGDPDAPRIIAKPTRDALLTRARALMPGLACLKVTDAALCFYMVAPQDRLLVAEENRLMVLSPCSGHGFKFAPLIGERVVETLLGHLPAAALTRWAAGAN